MMYGQANINFTSRIFTLEILTASYLASQFILARTVLMITSREDLHVRFLELFALVSVLHAGALPITFGTQVPVRKIEL